MQFTISKEALIKPLQRTAGVAASVEKRQILPILGNILMVVKNQLLSLVGTDLEIEMVARIPLVNQATAGSVAVSGKKLMDICKSLPEQSQISFEFSENKMLLRAGRSRFALACVAPDNFPRIEESVGEVEISVGQSLMRQLFDATSFAMAHSDVRYYLNGVCLIFSGQELRLVATDGHRLATMTSLVKTHLTSPLSVIVPRKAILEMQRLFAEGEEEIGLVIGKNHLRAVTKQSSFVTKLIEGKFPDYRRVLPENCEQQMQVPRELFRQALLRVSALFSDKYRGVGLQFSAGLLKIVAVTPEKDEVEDEVEIMYQGPSMEIGLNSSYLIEFLNIIKSEMVRASFTNPQQVVLFEAFDPSMPSQGQQHFYVVMPMRL